MTDSRPELGNGHLKRGLDILHTMLRRDPGRRLALSGHFSSSAQRFIDEHLDKRIAFHDANGEDPPRGHVVVLDTQHRPGNATYFDPEQTKRVAACGDHFVIISSGLRVELPLVCDLFIDHFPDVEIAGEIPREKRTGFKYAPVSAEFYEDQDDLSAARPGGLVAVLGGGSVQTGPERLAGALFEQARQHFPGFTMVVTPHYPPDRLVDLRLRYPELEVLQGVPTLAPLIRHAGAVICTYGHTTYEALSSGRPVFLASYLNLQNEYGEYLESRGLVVNMGFLDRLDMDKAQQLLDVPLRDALALRASGVFTRPGIEAIVDSILELFDK